jgi:hypothetical protein
MITRVLDSEINDVNRDLECIRPRILSQKTTDEILAENLSSIVAISKEGFPYFFLPYGSNENSNHCELCDEDAMTLIDITIQIPKLT